jgi:hypothetical protein
MPSVGFKHPSQERAGDLVVIGGENVHAGLRYPLIGTIHRALKEAGSAVLWRFPGVARSFNAGFLELADSARWPEARRTVEARGMVIPMLCCTPDFTHPDPAVRAREVEQEKRWIRLSAALGADFCRVLSDGSRLAGAGIWLIRGESRVFGDLS